MKINILTNENNIIIQWTSYPLDESKPILDIKDPDSIHLGVDKFVDGKLVRDSKKYKKILDLQEKQCKIQEFKKKLAETDYKLFKYLDGELTNEEYESIKAQRHEWREQINQLEDELK